MTYKSFNEKLKLYNKIKKLRKSKQTPQDVEGEKGPDLEKERDEITFTQIADEEGWAENLRNVYFETFKDFMATRTDVSPSEITVNTTMSYKLLEEIKNIDFTDDDILRGPKFLAQKIATEINAKKKSTQFIRKNAALLTSDNILAMDSNLIGATFTSADVSNLSPDALRGFDITLLPELTPSAMSGLKKDQISFISPSAMNGLGPAQISFISPSAMNGFGPAQIAALNSEQISEFTPEQFKYLNENAMSGFGVDQIEGLNKDVMASMVGASLNLISLDAMSGFGADQMEALPDTAMADMDADHFNSITLGAMSGFGANQIGAISNNVMAGMDADHLNSIALPAMSGLKTDQMEAISNNVMAGMDADHLNSITPAAMYGITQEQMEYMSLDQINVLEYSANDAINANPAGGLNATVGQPAQDSGPGDGSAGPGQDATPASSIDVNPVDALNTQSATSASSNPYTFSATSTSSNPYTFNTNSASGLNAQSANSASSNPNLYTFNQSLSIDSTNATTSLDHALLAATTAGIAVENAEEQQHATSVILADAQSALIAAQTNYSQSVINVASATETFNTQDSILFDAVNSPPLETATPEYDIDAPTKRRNIYKKNSNTSGAGTVAAFGAGILLLLIRK